jgi:hypothetical protein
MADVHQAARQSDAFMIERANLTSVMRQLGRPSDDTVNPGEVEVFCAELNPPFRIDEAKLVGVLRRAASAKIMRRELPEGNE